ncbi:MAG TPA: TonB-dependent receptor [Allosphingosinicella sp.]|jgi:outer membrane receptor protein involved in Fe transport
MPNGLFKSALLASSMFAGSAVLATPAFAQATAEPVEAQPDQVESPTTDEIVVTGSRIARPNLEQSSPVSVVDAEEIALTQPVSAEEFLRELPGTVPGIGPAVNNGANGSATLNLRGLGTNRNLILLNERRIVPATLGAVVDLNIVPVALLERVDVFTGGASSVYGADAIAGVVNFITRRNFAGLDVSGNYGITERGDGASYRADLTMGANFDDNRGNAVFSVSYTNTQPVLQGSRPISLVSRASTCTAGQVSAGTCEQQTVGAAQGSNTAVPASLFFPLGLAGTPIQVNGGQFDAATGGIVSGLSNYNFNPVNIFQTPLDRWSLFGQARYEVSPAVEVFTEGFFVRSTVRQEIAPTGTFTNVFQVPLNNQFLTPATRLQLCGLAVNSTGAFPAGQTGRVIPTTVADCPAAIASGTEINAIIARRFVETGPRVTEYTTNTFQVVGGLRGALTANLDWELSGQYGESRRVNTSTGTALQDRVQQALRGCPTGSTSGCVPINIFGGEGTLTPAMLAFVGVPTSTFINTELGAAQATVSGDLGFSSPFANEPIGIAVGLEYRRYAGGQFGDLPSSTPGAVLGAGGAFLTVNGEYNSKEAFAELVVPLVEERPFFHNLTVEAGARYADNSISGGDWTYKVGGNYSPIPEVKFRGVYSRSVRAANLGELFAPRNTVLSNLATDPCQGTRAQVQARGANHIAVCEAQLVAAGLPTSTLGGVPAPIAGQVNVTTQGNTNLDPEVADTLTAGVVLQPRRFLSGFALTFDWYRIKVKEAITAPGVSDILGRCFATADPALCTLVQRNPLTGGLSGDPSTTPGVFLFTTNQGRLHTEGFDLTASYRRDLGFGILNLSFNGNHTTKSRFQAFPQGINRECVGRYSVSCDPPLPRYSANGRATLSVEDSDISLAWRHISRNNVEPVAPTPQVFGGPPTTGGPANVIGAYRQIPASNYFDLAFQQQISDTMRFTFLVQNLLDKDPPDVGNTIGSTSFNSGNTYPTIYDALGRRYTVGVNLRF